MFRSLQDHLQGVRRALAKVTTYTIFHVTLILVLWEQALARRDVLPEDCPVRTETC